MYVLCMGTYICKQACMRDISFEYIVGPRPQIQSLTEHGYQPACLRSVTSGLRGTSVTVRGIGVLNKWLKCATETQSLLASTPCWHKCHMITLGYRSWFHFNWTLWFRSRILKMSQQWRWQHVQPLRVLAIQNTRATIVVQSQRQAVTC